HIADRVFFPPSWAPDGKRIAFDSSGPTGTGSYDPRIYVADPAGRHRRRLVGSEVNGWVAWSPNGRWLAFGGAATNAVSAVRPDGTGQRRLIDADLSSLPVWAPDSLRLAVAYGPGLGGCLETWDARTGSVVRFTECGYQGPALAGEHVAFPVFEHALGTNSYGIRSATIDRPNPTWVTGLCSSSLSQFCIRD